MSLSVTDLYTTVTAAALGYGVYLEQTGRPLAFVAAHPRWSSLIVLFIGLTMCAAGGKYEPGSSSPMIKILSLVGFAAFALSIMGMATGNRMYLQLLVWVTLGMWAVTTVRHAFA